MKIGFLKYFLVFFMTFVSGASLMVVSHKVQRAESEILRMDRAIVQEQEKIDLLKAEWAYLNNPERLERLATRYLNLVPPRSEQLLSDFSSFSEQDLASEIVEEDLSSALASAMSYSKRGKGR